jgi:hypothetical protein
MEGQLETAVHSSAHQEHETRISSAALTCGLVRDFARFVVAQAERLIDWPMTMVPERSLDDISG